MTMSGSITLTRTCGTRFTYQKRDCLTERLIFRTAPIVKNVRSVQAFAPSRKCAKIAQTVSITLKPGLRLRGFLVTTVKVARMMPGLLTVKTVQAVSRAF